MSDYYYNENENQGYSGFGSAPQHPQPQQPPQPPQAPPMPNIYGTPTAPVQQPQYNVPPAAQPTTQAPPQAPVRNTPPYVQPQQAPTAPHYQPFEAPDQPQTPYYNTPYAPQSPQKTPMGAGLKALLIIVISVLFITFFTFIAYVAMNPKNSSGLTPATEATTETDSIPFGGYDFDDDEEATEPSTGDYKESDAKDKTDKDYKGLTLNKKPTKVSSDKMGSSYAFSKVEKSVVGIIGYVDGQEGSATSYTQMGTGIIITSDGYIVTNAHLVNYSRTAYKYKVLTDDKKEYDAGVVGYDSRSDLAVLKINAKGLTPATFGDSSQIEVTEDVIVVGNPLSFDYRNSVTKGIVSAVDRQVSITNNVKCIQTDAAINPGNSGGPLCNMYGQIIGITNSKIALDDFEGMGFAIPSKLVKSVTDDIVKYGYVKGRVRIGILGEVDFYNDSYDTGINVKEITKGGPMDGSGVQVGDFITKVEGKKVANFADIYDILENYKAGDKVKVTVYRPSDDREHEFTVTLEADES